MEARANQRHCLTLHVCTHERTLCVVMLKERNQVCRNGKKLSRRYVHAINVFIMESDNNRIINTRFFD